MSTKVKSVADLLLMFHRNERPIQITWQLHRPLPGDTFASYRATVA